MNHRLVLTAAGPLGIKAPQLPAKSEQQVELREDEAYRLSRKGWLNLRLRS